MIPGVNTIIAQSFIPSKSVLTRVELLIARNITTTYPYFLAIREDLNGEDLAVTSVDAEDVTTDDFDWVEFDFDDVPVTTGQTYYTVSYTANVTDNFYGWAANLYGGYPNGTVFISQDDEQTWEENETVDMAFMTYGRDNSPPEIPDISGETSGNAGTSYDYTFTAIDPDGDQVSYYIKWGDGDVTDWTAFQASGPPGYSESHTWSAQGTYTIEAKAKDTSGAESDWGTLTVTMPRNKVVVSSLFLRFLQQLPNMFPILRLLLGL